MKIKKYIISLCLVISVSVAANVKPGEETGEFHYFNVTNPAGFIEAIDEHYESDCAKKWQSESGAEVVVMGVLGSVHTHFIYVGYKNNDMLEKGRSIVNACPETAKLIKKLSKNSEPTDYVSRLGLLIELVMVGCLILFMLVVIQLMIYTLLLMQIHKLKHFKHL
ncbi:MAG: hypothetical protein EBW00_04280 [Proteobacteria bacterium]|nr:hypothetical protein [Pseudomonadota bacterium]